LTARTNKRGLTTMANTTADSSSGGGSVGNFFSI